MGDGKSPTRHHVRRPVQAGLMKPAPDALQIVICAERARAIMQNYQQIPKKLNCPICRTDNAHVLWCASSKQAAQHFVLQEKYHDIFLELVSHIERLWGQATCEVVQCDNCEFCYSNPYVAGDERFYRLAYVYPGGYPTWKWEFQLTYDVLTKSAGSDTTLLEIGAGDGAFIRRIANKILPKENILCTEFSEYGRRQIEKIGVRCLSDDVRRLSSGELQEKTIDIICMFQVLEHMDELTVLFERLNWLLKKGGSVFIAVPNPRIIEFDELNGAVLDMPPNHIGRWNKKCFEQIATQTGLHIEDYKIETSSFVSMARQFIIYRLLQRSQLSGSLENNLLKIRNRHLLRIMKMIGVAINAVTAIPALAKMNAGLGNSQWIHFIKAKE